MKRICLLMSLLCLFSTKGKTQNFDLDQRVTLRYSKVSLEEVLTDMNEIYNIPFSYSKDFIALDQDISYRAKNEKLSEVLAEIFKQANILHIQIGNQLVLKRSKHSLNERPKKKKERPVEKPLGDLSKKEEADLSEARPAMNIPNRLFLERYELEKLSAPDYRDNLVHKGGYVIPAEQKLNMYYDTRLAQVSVVPKIGTNREEGEDIVNNLSFNLFWGNNGGVDGVEVGGFVNMVKEDVKGVQIGGLVNIVGGDVRNSEWIDDSGEIKKGVQIGGLVNVAHDVTAYQVAGLVNVVKGEFNGFQFGGIGNVVKEDAQGGQIGGIFNHNEGDAGSQIAGITNVAEEVEGFQISGIFNKAKYVKRFQVGLINVSDSVGLTSVGLINIVKGGTNNFNRIEVSTSELLHINAGIKFGVRSFYNTIITGMRFKKGVQGWGIGYGIGTIRKWGPNKDANLELTALHLNERQVWTKKMNLLLSMKFLAHFRGESNQQSLYIGPSFNLLISHRRNVDTNVLGSEMVPYTLFAITNQEKGQKINQWIGFNAGFRF